MKKTPLLFTLVVTLLFGHLPAASAQEVRDRDIVSDIQSMLYEFGYGDDTDWPDGVMGPKTRSFISAYQESVGLPATGVLTDTMYEGLKDFFGDRGKQNWAALALSNDGIHISTTAMAYRENAVQFVLKECQERSAFPEDCTVIAISNDGIRSPWWIAGAWCQGRGYAGVYVANRPTMAEAADATIENAKEYFDASQCTVLELVQADNPL